MERQAVWWRQRWVWVFYGIGVLHWYFFMTWGWPDYNTHDWRYMHQWVAVMKRALQTGQIPYHAAYFSEELATGQFAFGDRYLALPFLIMSPQILALLFLDIPSWMTLQLILMYTLGFWGLVKWIGKLKLSMTASAFVLILFNLNGFHSSRIGIGHLQNAGYFLAPWWLYILTHFAEVSNGALRQRVLPALQFGLFLFFVLLQGSVQLVQNIVVSGICVLLFYPKQLLWYVLGGAVGLVLGSYLVWPVLRFSPYVPITSRMVWCSSYGTVSDYHGGVLAFGGAILQVLYSLYRGLAKVYSAAADGSWEADAYISAFGIALVLGACVGVVLGRQQARVKTALYSKRFAAGMLLVFLLSLDCVYHRLWGVLRGVLVFPAVDRFPSRLIIYVLTYLILVSSSGFDRLFQIVQHPRIRAGLQWISLGVLLLLLLQHSWVWSVSQSESHWASLPHETLTFGEQLLSRAGDHAYVLIVKISYLVSAIAAGLTVVGYLWLRRQARSPQEATLSGG